MYAGCVFCLGDPAIGDGVTRHFFSTVMSKLQYGFDIQFAPVGTLLFEGEKDHLIPSTSHFLLESDFFLVAGSMIGHWFLHGGPSLGGLSPAILHVLFGGSPEEATIDLKDCADLDIRETVKLLEGAAELSSEEKDAINVLAMSWDFPRVTFENRRWFFNCSWKNFQTSPAVTTGFKGHTDLAFAERETRHSSSSVSKNI